MKKIVAIITLLTMTVCAMAQSGIYTGKANAMVGGTMGPFESNNILEYTITTNNDNTINVTMAEVQYSVTLMGDISLGAYTVSNIPYDASKGAYYLDYASQNLTVDFTMRGSTSNYVISKLGNITVKFDGNKVNIVNYLQPGSMPFDVMETFDGERTDTHISNTSSNSVFSPEFTINGTRTNAHASGIIIRNGKKYVNK